MVTISDFRFQTVAREKIESERFHFNFRLRFQESPLRETKSNLELISGFHFDFKTELSITRFPMLSPSSPHRDRCQVLA